MTNHKCIRARQSNSNEGPSLHSPCVLDKHKLKIDSRTRGGPRTEQRAEGSCATSHLLDRPLARVQAKIVKAQQGRLFLLDSFPKMSHSEGMDQIPVLQQPRLTMATKLIQYQSKILRSMAGTHPTYSRLAYGKPTLYVDGGPWSKYHLPTSYHPE